MSEKIIKINWDGKNEPLISPDSIKGILEAYCPTIDFKIEEIIRRIYKVCRSGWAEEETEDSIWASKESAEKRCRKLNTPYNYNWHTQVFKLNKKTMEYEFIL